MEGLRGAQAGRFATEWLRLVSMIVPGLEKAGCEAAALGWGGEERGSEGGNMGRGGKEGEEMERECGGRCGERRPGEGRRGGEEKSGREAWKRGGSRGRKKGESVRAVLGTRITHAESECEGEQ